MTELLSTIAQYVWGLPLITLLLGVGIFLTVRLRGIQFRTLFSSLYLALIQRKEEGHHEGDISHFQSLMTALAATVGTGNIAGVATAIAAGGPGALFWMWVTGFVGMATKYSEAVLAVKYRVTDGLGTMSGGPMYYIERGLKMPWLAKLFAVFAAVAAFGIGNMVQANSIADVMNSAFGVKPWIIGLFIMGITFLVIMGGIKSIARATSLIVPVMIFIYMTGAIVILILYYREIPGAFGMIFEYAFTPASAAGGFLGATVQHAIRMGVARGIFSNESGLGSSPIAAAAAKTDEPVRQALVSMTQTFIDTIIICTMTGLVLIVTGVWNVADKKAAALTAYAFETGLPGQWGSMVVALGLVFFAYSTILGWSYYGEKSMEYLFGERSIKPYRLVWVIFVFVGATVKIDLVWSFSDIMNGLMAVPNLIALILLSGVVVMETNKYFVKYRK
ncbi:MAG TPA: sodium:alanine symporter family protein [Spirochaetota bacterium]|nr:sodium:alanine symporter family protein [Spirochaetota bacterium]HQP50453.1 sodium:alanine symporter family protein [Spirochaetota bacterium]